MSGGSAKRFSIENPGACPRRARDGCVPPGACCLWTCTLVINLLSWEWRVGEKETEGLMLETIERASEWVEARRRRRLVTCRPSCLHKDRVLRLRLGLRFASPQNINSRECFQMMNRVLALLYRTLIALFYH